MDQVKTLYVKKILLLLFLIVVIVAGSIIMLPGAALAETASQKNPSYTVFKGGYYYPSERIRLDEFSGTDFDRKKGIAGEIGFGHHYGPVFGTEFGVGYLENRRFPGTGSGRTRLEAIPVLLSARLFLPLGPLEPYGEIGVGAYFSKLEIESPAGTSSRAFREIDWGPHAGVGININLTDTLFIGMEGRYRKVRPEYGNQTVRLDGYTATANLGFRY
ncbi:MAG: hypothetical protein A2010_00125 [Nitrospirae bacterium GWD2_57_9]|nr:MAG: hypothetical protein A2010_00125 [Nitrospirae bacterium GWD2_57_9]OGW47742.1 MAG: hypothetical protein A2078_05350 [Nitrospirae bacterium GWC2_57_9]